MRVLITGGGGALGNAVIARMDALGGYKVTTVGRRRTAQAADHVSCDVSDAHQLASAFGQINPDLVLHLAATFTGTLEEVCAINVTPAKHLLDLVLARKPDTRVLLIGSAAEYGRIAPQANPLKETQVLAPVSIYGLSKAWQTQLITLYGNLGIDVVGARIFNLFGAGIAKHLFAGRVQCQIEEVLAGQRSVIEVGPLSAIRDYISTDQAAGQLLAISAKGERGQIYHVASGVPTVMRELLSQMLTRHGLDFSIVREASDLSNHVGYDAPAIYADITKTNDLF